ncbi:hypothetical protein [Microlunatus flavus]|uniref:Uncharacterized protein n=1 Tax=Microlunatus flavus TaxID=1036181 RepID=A0A1H9B0B7_9ACTN|nr:hypothetical protein [Microlunatus flavus]SEP82424.1 hypothetical protein SAMN05421756_101796 [Microlunatus flavus]
MSQPPYGYGPSDDRRPEPGGPPLPLPLTEQPPRMPAPGARVGRAYGVQVRQESQYASNNAHVSLTVLEFRLAEPGNPQPLDVLMRGRSLSGTVRDGDWVEVAGPPDATNRWNLQKLQNLTTGSTVVVTGGRTSKVAAVIGLTILGAMLLVFVVVLVGVLTAMGS